MAQSMVFKEIVTLNGSSLTSGAAGQTVSGDGMPNIDATIPDSSTDLQIAYTLDVSTVTGFYMISDAAITIETNDGTTPADTVTLAASVPYVWYTGKPDAFIFGTDVTDLYVTNSSGGAANLQILAVVDATP